ncbi:hypothetical protein GJ744_010284 [Endocarpon pusillum]|uniref:Uncharacterized protein n=1 Tax=Endocarpon pusillum TaxID=364733 RepID=A0A8H7AGE5_9EURO|nr:hypothetical protein GJ744_010284 [Endocarpon pusillum]
MRIYNAPNSKLPLSTLSKGRNRLIILDLIITKCPGFLTPEFDESVGRWLLTGAIRVIHHRDEAGYQ